MRDCFATNVRWLAMTEWIDGEDNLFFPSSLHRHYPAERGGVARRAFACPSVIVGLPDDIVPADVCREAIS
jgi:hypothetical protein